MKIEKIGVLLVNLGTPDSPNPKDVKRYLAEFLSDPRVIEVPKWIWNVILHGIILNTRPKKSAEKYQKIWTEEGSPLLSITRKQTELLQSLLPDHYVVTYAMRYGNPSIEKELDLLIQKKVDKIIVLPLYPQYSAATTATVFDGVAKTLMNRRYFPQVEFLGSYFDHASYISACVEQIKSEINDKEIDQLVLSYHGMPEETYQKGDPYYDECTVTSELIAQELGLKEDQYQTVFQSRFGPAEWLKPYASQYLSEAPHNGIKNVAVFCPGFSADCLETLEEMQIDNREKFIQAGGKNYYFIPCLNDKLSHVELMKQLILKSL